MAETPPPERVASCACGQLTVTARGEPLDVYVCSCHMCQKKSGSTFTYGAVFPQAATTIDGAHNNWRYTGNAGRWIEPHFCPCCGGSVFFHAQALTGLLGINAGCFTDQDFPRPTRLFWASRRHHWLDELDEVARVETQP